MKGLAKKFIIAALGAVSVACLCAAACASDNKSDKPAEVADAYGYMRPTDAWITQSVILNASNYEAYKNSLFGTAGASGLLNDALGDLDGEGITANAQSYLVYLIYCDGLDGNGCAFDTRFGINYAEGSVFYSGADCPVSFGEAIYDSNKIKLSLDMSKPEESRFSVSPVSATESRLQTVVAIPFTPASDGVLFTDMRIDAPYLSAGRNSFVDGVHTARVGGFTHGFSAAADDVKIRFARADDCPDGEITESALKYGADFDSGETVYAVIDFTVGALSDNAGGGTFTANIIVPETELTQVTVIEATTGNINDRTENGYTRVDANFSVPDLKANKKPARVVLRIRTQYDGFADIGVCFSCKGADLGCKPYYGQRLKWGEPIFRYNYETLKEGGSAYITGLWDKSLTEVTLPETYADKSVSGVREGAFDGTAIKKLTISAKAESVIESLKNCYALKEITFTEKGNANLLLQDGVLYYKSFLNYDHTPDNTLFVPKNINGSVKVAEGVKEIRKNFFAGTDVTGITLPDSVKKIDDYAFKNCKSLQSVSVGDGVETIGSEAFYNCSELSKITLGKSVVKIGSLAFWGTAYNKDKSNWYRGALYIGDCLISVNYGNGNSYRGTFSVSNGTRVIADYAVNGDVTGVTIPDSVIAIGTHAFNSTEYYRTESNWTDGVLYIGKFLVGAKEISKDVYQIKKGTTVIADGALRPGGNVSVWIDTLILPDSVKIIGRQITNSVHNIVIGSGVTSFGENCFGYNSFTIYYNGTKSKWETLDIDGNQNYELFIAKKYYYSAKKPAAENEYWRYVDGVPTPW